MFGSEKTHSHTAFVLGKAQAASLAVVSQGAVLRGCSAPHAAVAQRCEAADRRLCSAGTFWESTGHSPALLRWRCQCKNSLIWSASLRDSVGIFVLVVLGLNRGKDPTEAMKKSCGNRRGALGSGGGRGAPSWGLRPSRGLALHLSAVRTAAALIPQVGEAGRRKKPPRSPGGGRTACSRSAAPSDGCAARDSRLALRSLRLQRPPAPGWRPTPTSARKSVSLPQDGGL